MFDSIRSHRRWLMLFMLLLVFPSFVVTGIYGYNSFVSTESAVATVGGEPVTQAEFDAAQRAQLDRFRRMFGQNFDASMFDTPASRAATLDALLSDRALVRETAARHVSVSEDRLREVIASERAFHKDGKFDYDTYKQVLTAQGLTELGFEQRVRDGLQRQTLVQAVSASAMVPRTVAEHLRQLTEEQRQIRELRLAPADFAGKATVEPDAVKRHYETNQSEFMTPETVTAEFAVLRLEDIAAQIAVPEGELQAYYEQNKDRWGQPEQRRASHILFTAGEGGSAKDKDGARKLAQDTLAKVRGAPREFERLARELSKDPGSATNGGDLGFFGRNMMVKPFEEAAFALKEGQISDVVESDFGFHLIKVTGIRAAQTKPFAEVRGEIERDLKQQQAQKRFAEASEQFTNTVYEQPDTLQPVAERFKLAVQRMERLGRAGPQPGSPNARFFTPKLVQALFNDETLRNKRNTEAVEVESGVLVAARVVEHQPAALRPFAAVEAEIKRRLIDREAARLARQAGAARLEALNKKADDAGFGAPKTVSRLRPEGLPPAAVNSLMRVPADKLPAYVGAELDAGVYGVFKIVSATVPPVTAATPEAANQTRALLQQYGSADERVYLEALKKKHRVEVLKPELKNALDTEEAK
jgi:peptidyl-prolyl cis-trans isomerase D